MKKRGLITLCALLFALSGIPVGPVQAAPVKELFFVAMNDSAPELSGESAPIWIGNTAYIPCSLLEQRITGVNFGISYSWSNQAIVVFKNSKSLKYDISTGKAYADGGTQSYDYQAVIRNGRPYVPAVSFSRYFDLQATMLFTTSGPLLRIKDGNQSLADGLFVDSVEPLFATRLAQYNRVNGGQGGGSGGTGSTPVISVPDDNEAVSQRKAIYMAVRVAAGQELNGVIASLNSRNTKALFFFSPEDLVSYETELRRLVGNGHRVGFIPQGGTLEEQLASLKEGNRLLTHILRQETMFVLSTAGSGELENGLVKAGYLPWKAGITVEGQRANALVERIQKQQGRVRVLLPVEYGSREVGTLLRELQEGKIDVRLPRETSY